MRISPDRFEDFVGNGKLTVLRDDAKLASVIPTLAKAAAVVLIFASSLSVSPAQADGFGTASMGAPTAAENLGKQPEIFSKLGEGVKAAAKTISDSQKGGYVAPDKTVTAQVGKSITSSMDWMLNKVRLQEKAAPAAESPGNAPRPKF